MSIFFCKYKSQSLHSPGHIKRKPIPIHKYNEIANNNILWSLNFQQNRKLMLFCSSQHNGRQLINGLLVLFYRVDCHCNGWFCFDERERERKNNREREYVHFWQWNDSWCAAFCCNCLCTKRWNELPGGSIVWP